MKLHVEIMGVFATALIFLTGSWAYTLCFEATDYGGWFPFALLVGTPIATLFIGIYACFTVIGGVVDNIIDRTKGVVLELEEENVQLKANIENVRSETVERMNKAFTAELHRLMPERFPQIVFEYKEDDAPYGWDRIEGIGGE